MPNLIAKCRCGEIYVPVRQWEPCGACRAKERLDWLARHPKRRKKVKRK